MVLVGHSMGGLVSRMQTIESGDEFWRIVSDESFDQIQATEEEKRRLASVLFFNPNPSVQRVVTIATPHRGSYYANGYTQWLGKKFIQLPSGVIEMGNSLIRQNPGVFKDTELLITKTSIDSLNPDSPIFPVLLRSRRAPWVRYHNIVGMIDKSNWFSSDTMESDGIVTFASAQVDDVQTQIVVQANHGSVHTTPRAILGVRRILIEHLREAGENPQLAAQLDLPEEWKQMHRQLPKKIAGGSDWSVQPAGAVVPKVSWPKMHSMSIQSPSIYPLSPEGLSASRATNQTLR